MDNQQNVNQQNGPQRKIVIPNHKSVPKKPYMAGVKMSAEQRQHFAHVAANAVQSAPKSGSFLSFNGRAARGEWWLTNFLVGGLGILVAPVLVGLGLELDLAIGLAMLILSLLTIPVEARRWHDLDQSGWLVLTRLLNLIPILGFICGLVVFVFVGCIRGTKGKNTYGEDPLGSSSLDVSDVHKNIVAAANKRKAEEAKEQAVAAAKKSTSIKERLTRLEELKTSGLVSEEEYAKKRAAILADL